MGGESAATFALANEVKAVALSAKDAGDPPHPLPKPSPPPAQAVPKEESRRSHEQVAAAPTTTTTTAAFWAAVGLNEWQQWAASDVPMYVLPLAECRTGPGGHRDMT